MNELIILGFGLPGGLLALGTLVYVRRQKQKIGQSALHLKGVQKKLED